MQEQKQNPKHSKIIIIFLLIFFAIAIGAIFVLTRSNSGQTISPTITDGHFAILNPKGIIAQQEKDLMVRITLLMLIVAIPALCSLFFVAWKYRASKNNSVYLPNQVSGPVIGISLWLIPITIITIIGVINWKSTHKLDPYQTLASNKKPITIEVVALQWKWLFIYPEAGIATVNFIEFPENTPINFKLTAEAPMNSFWIPQLGGQMYAMTGMQTKLHLMADKTGEFVGSDAEISGKGFAGMKFIAKSVTDEEFNSWVKSSKNLQKPLSLEAYNTLSAPSEDNSKEIFSSVENGLFDKIMMKFMAPASKDTFSDKGDSMQMKSDMSMTTSGSDELRKKAEDAVTALPDVKKFISAMKKSNTDYGIVADDNLTDADSENPYYLVEVFAALENHNATHDWYKYYIKTGKIELSE